MTGRSQTAQQLCFLGGELLIAENPLRVQCGELLNGGEHVCLAGDRLSADGLLLHRRRRRLRNPTERDNRQAGDSNQAVLARECEGRAAGLLLREAADLVIERIVDRHLAVHFDRQVPGRCEVGIADVVLGTRCVGPPQISGPSVARGAGRGRNEQTHRFDWSGCSLLLLPATVTSVLLLLLAATVVALLLGTLVLRLEAAAANQVGLVCHQAGKLRTELQTPACSSPHPC